MPSLTQRGMPPHRRPDVQTGLAALQCLLCLLVLCLGWLPRAHAGPISADDGCLNDMTCKTHYERAVKFFEEGRFESALPEFQAAYARRQMPWLLINMGRTLHRLGRPREALDHYERYKLAESRPDAETQATLEKYIAQARALADLPGGSPAQTPVAVVAATPPPDKPEGTPVAAETPRSPSSTETPIYKKWWFWTAVGGAAGVILITGIAVGASRNRGDGLPDGLMKVKFAF